MARRVLLIVNAKSRSGREIKDDAVAALHARGFESLMRDCATQDDVRQFIEEVGEQTEAIIVAGGDGSLNCTLSAILKVNRPLGVLPSGTANDFARTLGLPTDLEDAIDVIAAGHKRRIDVGMANDYPFLNVASIGLSTSLAQELTPELKKRFSKLAYAIAALRVLKGSNPFRVTIKGETTSIRSTTLQLAVGNGRYYGGGNAVSHAAHIDDGVLDLYSLEFAETWRLLWIFWAFRRGEHVKLNEVRNMRGQYFEVHTRRPRSVNADGEILTKTPVTFRILPQALDVFVPHEE